MDERQFVELTEEEQEFLHQMFLEEDDFDKWADDMDNAIENGEIEIFKEANDDFEFDL